MVFYFTSSGHTIYMGKDKFENEDLIRYGFLEDIWFHVHGLSSAHVYLRLPLGRTKVDDVSETCLEECAQLVKACWIHVLENSIEGSKKKSISVCYIRWRNLKKTLLMEVGQVGFNHPERKNKDIVRRLNKTKQEFYPDLEEERWQLEQRKAKQEFKQQKELRSYSSLMLRDNIDSGAKLTAAADLSSVNAYEEDFM
ncbi:unnamed protein product [Peronospora destructor]|uniref:NFACT RNA-binding domain-containing protein n=1 Tax=Peronospora destructor TaxID=86335 RepID=A0AAV0VAJ6_9STRA|nr:unnamed protein product [Peronospora destructor]